MMHPWRGSDQQEWQVWSDGKTWRGDREVKLPRPVADEIIRLSKELEEALLLSAEDE